MLRLLKYCLFVSPLILFGCVSVNQPQKSITPCSKQWFDFIEKTLITGDSHGHGPDLGSSEWRSVVEFKLGIREDTAVPDSSSDKWCGYIDHYVKTREQY